MGEETDTAHPRETSLRAVDWPARRLIGVTVDRWAGVRAVGSGLESRLRATLGQATAGAKATARAAGMTTAGGSAAAVVAASKGGTAAAAASSAVTATSAASAAAATAVTSAMTSATAVATAAAGVAGTALGALLAAPAAPAVLAVGAAGAVGAGALRLWRGALEAELRRVEPGNCAGLHFPPGHPQSNHVYVLHPLDTDRYLRLEDFHRHLFSEKHAELLSLLTALGARRIETTACSGHTAADGFSASGTAPLARDAEEVVLADETLGPPADPAQIPAGLRWLAHEPAWQEAAAQVLRRSNTDALELVLRWDDDLGVSAALAQQLRRAGWSTDPAALSYAPTVWRLRVSFA